MLDAVSVYDLEIDYIQNIDDESLIITALAVAREAAGEGRGHGQYTHANEKVRDAWDARYLALLHKLMKRD